MEIRFSDEVYDALNLIHSKISVLGRGRYSSVYLVEGNDKRKYAVKVFRRDNFVEREWEAKIEKSPHLIQVFDKFEIDDDVFVKLEYANNFSFSKMMAKNRCHMLCVSTKVLFQLLNGLHVLHKNGCIHRLINPDNVLFNKEKFLFDGKEVIKHTVKICEHSSYHSLYLDTERQITQLRNVHIFPLSSMYLAPELLFCEGFHYDRKVDVWSCGLIFYQLLTSRQYPFEVHSLYELREMVAKFPPARPSSPPIGNDAWDLLKKMLQLKPAKRISVDEALSHPLFMHKKNWLDPLCQCLETNTTNLPNFSPSSPSPSPSFFPSSLPSSLPFHTSYNVPNGLCGIGRNVILRLCFIAGTDGRKVKALLGMCVDHFLWKNHNYFTRGRIIIMRAELCHIFPPCFLY